MVSADAPASVEARDAVATSDYSMHSSTSIQNEMYSPVTMYNESHPYPAPDDDIARIPSRAGVANEDDSGSYDPTVSIDHLCLRQWLTMMWHSMAVAPVSRVPTFSIHRNWKSGVSAFVCLQM